MSLDKSIKHGKERRKPYRKSKAFDASCRNNGSCSYCRDSRLHSYRKRVMSAESTKEDITMCSKYPVTRCEMTLRGEKLSDTRTPLKMVEVDSTVVKSIGYNSKTETLFIEYLTGILYEYHFVSASVAAAIVFSDSVGKALQPLIKDSKREYTKYRVNDKYKIEYLKPFARSEE